MARNCGCSGSACGCLIVGASGISLSGTGTVADPYVVSLDESTFSIDPFIEFTDSGVLDFTVTGSGTASSPLNATATYRDGFGPGSQPLLAPQSMSGNLDLSGQTRPVVLPVTLVGNLTITNLPTPPAGYSWTLVLIFTQDATGGRTVTWPSSVGNSGYLTPQSAAGATTRFSLVWSGSKWWGY